MKVFRGKRAPRCLTLEAIPSQREVRQSSDALNKALADLFAEFIHQKLKTGELIVENRVVRVNPQWSNHEQESK